MMEPESIGLTLVRSLNLFNASIAFVPASSKCFFCFVVFSGEGIIGSIGVDGSAYREYKTGPNLLVSFTLIENFFFWVTQDKGKKET